MKALKYKKTEKNNGFTLIELLVGAFIFLVVALGAYQAFASVMRAVVSARIKTEALMLTNEQIEIARNLPYEEVGIVAGVPVGKIPREQSIVRSGKTFKLTASVRNVDDPFDGAMGSTTRNDLAPADYKQVEFIVSCESCLGGEFIPQTIVTTIAPRNLETTTGNGSLFVRVFNANGDPVSGATIRIQNDEGAEPIDISEVSNNEGIFQLVDTPPGALAYRITVSKTGYSSDGTIVASVSNPNPLIPPATVAGGQLTQLSFAIDLTSHLQIRTINSACSARSGAVVRLLGQKKIGQTPDVFKIDSLLTSDGTGLINLPNQEWDTYQFLLPAESSYALAGSLPISPLRLSPGTDQEVSLVLVPKHERGLLAVVVDAVTGLPLSDAEVTVAGETLATSQGYFSQSDWSGGAGQAEYTDLTRFADTDGNLDVTGLPGEIRLRFSLDQFMADGYLLSSVFDTGGTSTQYASVSWTPADQSASTTVRLQIASGNDPATTTWNWRGPDGTAGSFYTVPETAINSIHNGDQFLRYKVILATASSTLTANVSDINLTYTSHCTPPGQAYFEGLTGDAQTISVTRSGYTPYSSVISTTAGWQMATILMQPE